MVLKTLGIHHISVVAQHPQENVDFYTSFLGLRWVKNTLNFDDKTMYHFYYGNHDASINLSTFFPMPSSDEGIVGVGQVAYQTYVVPMGSFEFWEKRLNAFGLSYYYMIRFGKQFLIFQDTHGYELELVEANIPNISNKWEFNGVTKDVAIQGIDSAMLYSSNPESTYTLLTKILGYREINKEYKTILLESTLEIGGRLELSTQNIQPGKRGYGTVHHIALKVEDGSLEAWKTLLETNGYQPTQVRKRKYFEAIYFRDHGGILFELSTLSPGMTVDENVEELGSKLIIPPHYQNEEASILEYLPPVKLMTLNRLETYSYRTKSEYDFVEKRKQILGSINKIKSKEVRTSEDEKKLEALRKAFKASRKDYL